MNEPGKIVRRNDIGPGICVVVDVDGLYWAEIWSDDRSSTEYRYIGRLAFLPY